MNDDKLTPAQWARLDELERRDNHETAVRIYLIEMADRKRNEYIESAKQFGLALAASFVIAIFFLALTWFCAR